ncbi:MAG TPA: hypothetical protein VMF08_18005 [Candidatus Sulfotelmatobacter sp.]|nr:hypothetical protein [Candidatus Sulfotelmatobacter sp.]
MHPIFSSVVVLAAKELAWRLLILSGAYPRRRRQYHGFVYSG